MQSGVGEFHLGLAARNPCDTATGRARFQVVEQCGLADPGLASHHEHLTPPRPCASDQIVEDRALAAPAVQRSDAITLTTHVASRERAVRRTAKRLYRWSLNLLPFESTAAGPSAPADPAAVPSVQAGPGPRTCCADECTNGSVRRAWRTRPADG